MNDNGRTLSIVIPAYNEEGNIKRTAEVVTGLMKEHDIPVRLIFVDDGSRDRTWALIEEVSEAYDCVSGLRFSRNFGKEAAIFAGLEISDGACCCVMDCDLQHPPETIIEMYRLWQNGFEVIEGVKEDRGRESIIYKGFSKLFYRMMSKATGIDMSRASDFKLMDRSVVDSIVSMPERNTFFRAMSSWVGYKTTYVSFRVREREIGSSKWNFFKLTRYAVNNIMSFTTSPLYLVTVLGMIFLALAFILGIDSLFNYITRRAVEGFTTVILIELIVGSVVMISLGIIGAYVGKIYEEVKGRHRYIIADTASLPDRRNDRQQQ